MYKIKKEGKCYQVIGKRNKIHAKCSLKRDAEAQIRLLEQIDSKKGGMLSLSPPEPSQHDLIYNAIALLPLSQPALNTYSKIPGTK
jgi:hypothetical protein